jgi:hypothetical protein
MTQAEQLIAQFKAELEEINELPSYEALVEKYGCAAVHTADDKPTN